MLALTNMTAGLADSLLLSVHPPAPVHPVFPNFATCDAYYGRHLSPFEAENAAAQLPFGDVPVNYYPNNPHAPFHIPFSHQSNFISVQVDYAGPFFEEHVPPITLAPNDLRGMAGFVLKYCIKERGVGGFATIQLSHLLNYVVAEGTDIRQVPYPPSTVFATVTIGSRYRYLPPPGSFDPATAQALQEATFRAIAHATPAFTEELSRRASAWKRQALIMRAGLKAWWDFLETSNDSASQLNKPYATSNETTLEAQLLNAGSGAGRDAIMVSKGRRRGLLH